jgi:hypothetical protein
MQYFAALLEHPMAGRVLKLACLISLVDVCLHTPRTLQLIPNLNWIMLILDGFVVAIFTGEALIRASSLGLIRARLNLNYYSQSIQTTQCFYTFSVKSPTSVPVGANSTLCSSSSTGPLGCCTSTKFVQPGSLPSSWSITTGLASSAVFVQ